MTRPSRTMADTRCRRASTGRMIDEIMELARSLPLTRQVLADSLETATPTQMEFMLSWMNEELASRERSKRTRLPEQAGLVMRLLRASAEGRLDRELAAISKARLLVIDELGYMPVDEEGSRLLFQIVTNAYERQSVIYTTNIEFNGWGRVFGDPNMATAIVDRTVHHGRMIRFEGESYRRTHALMG